MIPRFEWTNVDAHILSVPLSAVSSSRYQNLALTFAPRFVTIEGTRT